MNAFVRLELELIYSDVSKVRKVGDRGRGRPEGSFFNSYYTEV